MSYLSFISACKLYPALMPLHPIGFARPVYRAGAKSCEAKVKYTPSPSRGRAREKGTTQARRGRYSIHAAAPRQGPEVTIIPHTQSPFTHPQEANKIKTKEMRP